MKKLLLTFALVVSSCVAVVGQGEPPPQAPQLFDEFGDIQTSDWLARLDNLAIELNKTPSAKVCIVAYGVPNDLPGWPLRRANWARGYLVKGRGLSRERVEIVYGGHRDAVMYQHWVLQPGTTLPVQPFDFATALVREKAAYKFDQFYIYDPIQDFYYEGDYSQYLDAQGRYEPLVLALRADTAARGCIITYASHRDRRGTDRTLAARHKRALMLAHSIGANRIVAIGGGAREHREAELWIVPPGSALPKPTPTARPAARRRRP
jgi:hypothetical protein